MFVFQISKEDYQEYKRRLKHLRNDIIIRTETYKDYREIISLILRPFSA